MTGDLRPLRYPVRITWFARRRYLKYQVIGWCRDTYGAASDRYVVHRGNGDSAIIDFKHESDLMLFLLKWGEYQNGL